MNKVILLIGLFFLSVNPCLPLPVFAKDNTDHISAKEEYELQERCSKRCEEVFRKEYAHSQIATRKDNEESMWMLTYQSHYNQELNKCFILKSFKYTANSHLIREIYDAYEQAVYGLCVEHSPDTTKDCSSREWLDIKMKTMEK